MTMITPEILAAHVSGADRSSVYHGIPMEYYNRETMEFIRKLEGRPVRVWFRGPRTEKPHNRQSICWKRHAKTFSVYHSGRKVWLYDADYSWTNPITGRPGGGARPENFSYYWR